MVQNWDVIYHVKHSRPDVTNESWKLFEVMDGAKMAAFLDMNRVMKYVLGTKNLGLKKEPNRNEKDL